MHQVGGELVRRILLGLAHRGDSNREETNPKSASDLLDEQGRSEAAIDCLRSALRASSDYADAMFNLALLLQHNCKHAEAAFSKRGEMRKDSPYRSGRSPDWHKSKNPACAAVKREEEEGLGALHRRSRLSVPAPSERLHSGLRVPRRQRYGTNV
jgi:hypothetical protein